MKLYNRTKVPDKIMHDVLLAAGRLAGARTSKVVVQVNPAKSFRCKGMAYKCRWVRMRAKCISAKGRQVNTDGGYFTITLPRIGTWGKNYVWSTDQAQAFFRVAIHEWAHIRDRQRDNDLFTIDGIKVRPFGTRNAWAGQGRGGRRMNHDARPEEVRANGAVYDAIHNKDGYDSAYDEIMALAMAMEETS